MIRADCLRCPFYRVDSEIMAASCALLPGRRMTVNTASPYDQPIRPPSDCPVNSGRGFACPFCGAHHGERR